MADPIPNPISASPTAPAHRPRRALLGAVASLGAAALAPAALLSPRPAGAARGPLRIIVGYAAGGATDRVARLLPERLGPALGGTVIVENKVGAGGRIAAQLVKAAQPDDDVLLLANPAVIVVAPLTTGSPGYDVARDFRLLNTVNTYDFGVAVGPRTDITDVNGLIRWLRDHPKEANFGVPATGSLPHFFGLMLARQAGVSGEIVGYNGSAPLANDLMGGLVPVAIDTTDGLVSLADSGRLRLLATSGTARNPDTPAVPTLREAGVDLSATGWNTFFAPAAMPQARSDELSAKILSVMQQDGVREAFTKSHLVPVAMDRERSAAMLRDYQAQWDPVIRASGVKN